MKSALIKPTAEDLAKIKKDAEQLAVSIGARKNENP